MFTANSTAPFFQQPHARMYPYPPLTAFRSVILRYAFTSIGRVPDFHPLRSASRRGRPCRPTHGRSGFTRLDTHSTTASQPHTALGLPTPAHPNSKVLYLVRPRSFFDSTVDFATPAHATDEQPALEARRPLYCGTPPRAPTHWVLCLFCPPIRDSPGSPSSMPHHSNEGIMSSTHPYALYIHYHHHQHSATSLHQQPQLHQITSDRLEQLGRHSHMRSSRGRTHPIRQPRIHARNPALSALAIAAMRPSRPRLPPLASRACARLRVDGKKRHHLRRDRRAARHCLLRCSRPTVCLLASRAQPSHLQHLLHRRRHPSLSSGSETLISSSLIHRILLHEIFRYLLIDLLCMIISIAVCTHFFLHILITRHARLYSRSMYVVYHLRTELMLFTYHNHVRRL
jgi:hypothetical protein